MTAKALALLGTVWMLGVGPLAGENITLIEPGRISLDFVSTEAQYRNTVFLVKATLSDGTQFTSMGMSGCQADPLPVKAGSIGLVTNKLSAFGCRITLDSNSRTPNQIEVFPAGTTFELGLCVDKLSNGVCDEFWSSDKNQNRDRADHLRQQWIRPDRHPGILLRLGWEDSTESRYQDFNDTVLYLRVERDRDGDGLWDDWEEFGIDTDGDGEIDFQLPGANPDRKDVYLEIDYMGKAGDGHDHKPSREAIQLVVDAFASAPVKNPKGPNGITLHVDVSNEIPHQDLVVFGKGFEALKEKHFDQKNGRRWVYRYAIFGHEFDSPIPGSGGVAETPGDDLMVTLTGVDEMGVAGTLMHELGHSLGLKHGGGDDVNDKPNYRSVMNYRFQYDGVPYRQRVSGGAVSSASRDYRYRIDFSRLTLPALDESNLDENTPLRPSATNDSIEGDVEIPVVAYNCPPAPTRRDVIVEAVEATTRHDWNCNGNRGDRAVRVDLNNDGSLKELLGHDDWQKLTYTFQNDPFRFGAVYREPNLMEQSPQQAAEAAKRILYRPIAIIQPTAGPVLTRQVDLDGSASFVPGGGRIVDYQWRVIGLPAALTNERGPRVAVQFGGGPGEYRFELTITGENGLTHTTMTAVVYSGR